MSTGPPRRNAPEQHNTPGTPMLRGWKHLQRALGVSLHDSVKRSRTLARAQLRRKR